MSGLAAYSRLAWWGDKIVAKDPERIRQGAIMYDERTDPGRPAVVLARGVLWLGAAEGPAVQQRIDARRCGDRVMSPLLGDAHGPRLLELLNAVCR